MLSRNVVAVVVPVVFVLMWSTGFIGARFGLPYAEPMTFLAIRMTLVVALLWAMTWIAGARRLTAAESWHSIVAGSLVHGVYLGGVFTAISHGVPAGIVALITGLQPILTAAMAKVWLGETVRPVQWAGLALGLVGVALVLHDRTILGPGPSMGWIASFASLIGITLGTLYQKKYCGGIDWRSGNLMQFIAAGALFGIAAFSFETREVQWSGPFVFALLWLALVLSIGAIGLMYWLLRRSAAARVSSLFYLVPALTALLAYQLFDERLDALSIFGMVTCAVGVFLVHRGPEPQKV
jgi:drug/metabolite transporter (DMT)-like permease